MVEGSEVSRVDSLRRVSSSNIWRNNSMDVFSTSEREDDEEALKWAAIERLPTYLRIRRSILNNEEGKGKEIDIKQLGLTERKVLLERLVKIAEDDNEKFLLKLRERMNRVGLDIPTVEVRFEHVDVKAQVYVGGRALPSLLNFFVNVLEGFLNYLHIIPSPKKPLHILQNVSGIIKPRRMTLLLGPPGSGKTTLLLALAGKLDKNLKHSGRVTYNGYGLEEFVPQRTSAYISQHDNHIGEMTVRETLAFSARCQGVGQNYEMLTELLRREKEAKIKPDPDVDAYMKAAALQGQQASVVTDYIVKILGLEICADIMVGDQMIRGISGGQKKRVTTGEMLVGPIRVLFMDEISTGLDSSTTYQIISSIRQSIHILNGTALVSLLQPAPETYELFDDIILLTDGQIVYQGPRENVLEFFESMGFKCPERKGVADFLQEVTSRKDQWQYWAHKDEPYSFVTVKDFAEAFQLFHIGQKLGDDLANPFDKSKCHPNVLTTKKYGVNKKELLKACASREFLLMKRNSFVYIFKVTQLIYLAIMTTTLFLRAKMHRNTVEDGGTYMGALFFTVIVAMFNGISELNMAIMKLPVFYKQRDLLFYPSWAYALPPWILKIPITLIEVFIWEAITYYAIGYDPSFVRLLKQYLIILCINQMASALFRMMAALGREVIVANTVGAFALLVVMVLGGFVISREDVPKWFLWGYWSSPLMYGQNAIAVNEFVGHSWRKVAPNSNETLGVLILKTRGFFPQAYWYWIGVGALIGYVFLFNFLFILALKYLSPFRKDQAGLSEENLLERNASLTAQESIQLTTQKSSSESKIVDEEISSSRSFSGRVSNDKASRSGRRGMVLPFQPLSLTFDEIKYSVDMPQEMKNQGVFEDRLKLLKGISGAFRPGVLTALMGVSGSGKTTLMDVLAGRKTGGYIEGNITISGYPKNQKTFARIAGYCEQFDIHSPNVTVYESLLYSAWLRLPPEVDHATRKMFIEEVMELVELNSLREALVGLPGENGLSTEQRKRLTIAVELVANPSIIFMDEPTSGLDARAAAIVMRTVRNTVDTGRTVVCTIHQPSIDIFDAFDELLLLKLGGEQIYAGPLGRRCSHLIQYFEAIEGVPKIKDGYNPATWMLEVTSAGLEASLKVNFTNVYRKSELYQRNKQLIQELSTPPQGSEDIYFDTQYSQTFVAQCKACLWKQHLSYWRNTSYTAVRLLFTTLIALLFGVIFWDIGLKRKKEQDLFNAMGSMYAAVTFIGVQNGASIQPMIAVERTVFYRERAAGMYSALPYALAQVIIELPHVFVQTLIYGIIVYAMMGLDWTTSKFLWYLFFMYFTFLYYTFYGMMTMAISPNPHVAGILSSAFYAIWGLFSGFIIPLSVITKLLYLLNQGETFTKTEATEVFFAVTKLFQSRDMGLRRMVYLMIKEISPSADEVIIVTSSLMKDMNSKIDMYRANAIRVLCRITDGTLLAQIERYLKQAIVDKNPVVASAALVSGIHLIQTNPEIVKRWSNEVQEAVQPRPALVQFHALALLHQIRQNDRLAINKLVTSLSRGTVRAPLAQCLLIRYISQVIHESCNTAQSADRPLYDYLENCLRHKSEMVIFEAARAITELNGVTSRELTPAITVLQLFLSSSKPVLRFAAVRTLNKVAMTHPASVTNCNIDMESLISDQNRSIATLAITTLLKTGNESSVDRLMKQITNFMSDIADEFKIVVVEAIRSLCLKFPLKYRSLMNFLSNILREEGGFDYKKAIVDSIVILIRDIPDAKEPGLLHLCEFIEDCEFTYLSTQILHFLGIEGPKTSDPSKYIRFVYNRVHLENATVRASAVSTLAKFGAAADALKPRIFVLLRRCLFDSDDEVRDRATLYLNTLGGDGSVVETDKDVKDFLFGPFDIPLVNLETSLKKYEPSEEAFDINSVPKEVKSQPLAEKKAPGKKPTGLGGPPSGPPSTADAYERMLSTIPEFANFGKLFKSSAPVELTEAETEYAVNVVKHIFDRHVVFQYNCTNTIPEQLLEDVIVIVDSSEAGEFSEVFSKPLKSLPYDSPGQIFVAFEKPEGVMTLGKFSNTLKFIVKEVDPSTGETDDDGVEDEYQLEDLEVVAADYMSKVGVSNFRNAWESMGPDCERVDEYGLGPRESLSEAVNTVINLLGLQPCEGTESLPPNSRSHTCLLSGVYIGNVRVLVRLSFGLDGPKDVAMKLTVRSEDESVSDAIHEIVASG